MNSIVYIGIVLWLLMIAIPTMFEVINKRLIKIKQDNISIFTVIIIISIIQMIRGVSELYLFIIGILILYIIISKLVIRKKHRKYLKYVKEKIINEENDNYYIMDFEEYITSAESTNSNKKQNILYRRFKRSMDK